MRGLVRRSARGRGFLIAMGVSRLWLALRLRQNLKHRGALGFHRGSQRWSFISAKSRWRERVAVRIPIEGNGSAKGVGILRLRKTIRFANHLASLRMTGFAWYVTTGFASLGMAGFRIGRALGRVAAIISIFLGTSALATTYYVSSSAGSDANSGTSSAAAWQTIAQVNGQTFLPGDQVLFRRGDVWNESLTPASSGTSGNPIAFDAYGAGPAPNFTGYYTVPVSAWVPVSGNAWKAPVPASYSTINFCLFGTVWGQKVAAVSTNLTAQWDFYFANGYVYVFSVGNPASYYNAAIVPMGLSNVPVVNTNGQSWLTFQHFLVNWFDDYGVYVQGASDHLVFANMEADSMIPQGTQPLGFYVNESALGPGDIKIFNSEVREHDYGWGQSNDRNLLGRFSVQAFTLPRLARTPNYFLRLFDGSPPPRYSRYSAALHVDYPLDF